MGTMKAGLSPNDIFQTKDGYLLHNNNGSDFEEKEEQQIIYNAEEQICDGLEAENKQKQNDPKPTVTENENKHKLEMEEMEKRMKEYEYSLGESIKKNLLLIEKNTELNKEREQYHELQTLFEGMSDKNTLFQKEIKDKNG